MNFQSMDYFTMVARKRSFTKASDALHITQQTLSAHIANIEQEIGCQLFVRHIPLELTYAGEIFLKYALDFQSKYRAMQNEFSDISKNQKGKLRIGIAFTRGHAIMPELIDKFQMVNPQIEVQLMEDANDALQKNLLDNDIDLAIASFPDKMTGITLRDFYEEEVVLLIADELLRQLYCNNKDGVVNRLIYHKEFFLLDNCPFLLNSENDIAGKIGRNIIRQANFQPIIKARSENVETLLELCVRGVGACFCPKNLAISTLSEQQLSSLNMFSLGDSARYMIRFGWLEKSYQWNMISNFIDIACRESCCIKK